MLLRQARAADPATASAEAQVCIQSLEAQLNDATQQLNQLRAERAPNAAEEQIAVQQSEINEQLEALRANNVAAQQALEEVIADRDRLRKANVQLREETLMEKAKWDTASSALEVRCLQAEAEVVELKEKLVAMERRGGYHVSPTNASATAGSFSQPAFGGKGSGLVAQVSPHPGRVMSGSMTQAPLPLGRGMSGLATRQLLTPTLLGRGLLGRLAQSGPGSLNPTPTPSPETGPVLGALAQRPEPKGLRVLWTSEGQVTPPMHPQLRLVHPAPQLTRALPRQDPTTYLSESEVTRLADRGAAPGHGTQAANLPRGVRFPNDSL